MEAMCEQSFVLSSKVFKTFLQPHKCEAEIAFVYSLSDKSINYSFGKRLKGSGCGRSTTKQSQKGAKNEEKKTNQKFQEQIKQKQAKNYKICAEHNMEFQEFCIQHQKLVCKQCKKTTHKGHQMENLQNVSDIYEVKAKSLSAQLKQKSQEVESNLGFIKTYIDCMANKKLQFKKFFQETITKMIRDLIVKGNQCQHQFDEWEFDIQNINLNLNQAWLYAKREYTTIDPIELVNIEENLRKLDSLQSDQKNMETLNMLNGYDPRNCLESAIQFRLKVEEELNQLKGLIFKSDLITYGTAKEFQQAITLKYDSNVKIAYNSINRKFSEAELKIKAIDYNYSQIEQFQEEGIIISGGQNRNRNLSDFTILDKAQSTQYQMLSGRQGHRTKFDGKDKIYIFSGENLSSIIKECEVFRTDLKSFNAITPIQTPVKCFGCDLLNQSILCFGGVDSQEVICINKIQIYETYHNSWKICQEILPSKTAAISAIYVSKLQAFLFYNSQTQKAPQIDTHIYDLKQILRHGEKLKNGNKSDFYTKPVFIQNIVYQFDGQNDKLFGYDLNNRKWNLVQ